ncbi:DUF1515 family protein [Bradyrhizobium sp. ma5]|uniref:DUF1515 family protein n=1 Tax=unclassified Bradyrhizobium TaxID=2631580 RepID=UPI001CC6DCF7|nr:DUF1515 family protein [Bradyrhizobium sp. RD5-C2]GIQ73172.1 hypothetical protein BraRD5C2_16100 [Bradyrhizobium sp. RD5-C2]
MSGDDSGSLNAALLQMAAKIGGLESTVSTLLQTWQRMEEKASEGRKDLHRKVDDLRADMTALGAQVATATKDIADMKPTVQTVQSVQAQATGVRNLSRWLYWFAALLSGGVGWILTTYLDMHKR